MSDMKKLLEGIDRISSEHNQINETVWTPNEQQKKWLGGADISDPFIIARMPAGLGPKPSVQHFAPGQDQALARKYNQGVDNINRIKGFFGGNKSKTETPPPPPLQSTSDTYSISPTKTYRGIGGVGTSGIRTPFGQESGTDLIPPKTTSNDGMKVPPFIENKSTKVPLKFHSVEISESEISNYVKDYFECYDINRSHNKSISNIRKFDSARLIESDAAEEISSFVKMIDSVDTTETIEVGDHFSVLSFEIIFAWKEINVSGFTDPKEVVDIKMHNDGSINYIKFSDGDRYPRITPATHKGKPIMKTAYFNDKNSADEALTALTLKTPHGWDLDTSDVKQGVAEGLSDVVKGIKRSIKGKEHPDVVASKHAGKARGHYNQGDIESGDKETKRYVKTRDMHLKAKGVVEGYILKKTKVEKTFTPGDPDEYYTSGGADVTRKDTDYEIINNKTGQVVGTASWTTNDYFGPGALKITMKNGATRYLDIWANEKGNPQTAFNRFVKDPKTSKKYKEQGVAEGSAQKFMIYFVVPDGEDYDDYHEPEERTIIVASNQSEAIKKFQAEIPGAYIKDIYPMEGQQGVAEGSSSNLQPGTQVMLWLGPRNMLPEPPRDNKKYWDKGVVVGEPEMMSGSWQVLVKAQRTGQSPISPERVFVLKQQGVAEGATQRDVAHRLSRKFEIYLENRFGVVEDNYIPKKKNLG